MYVLKGRIALVGVAVAFAALLVLAVSPIAQTQTTQGLPTATCFGDPVTDGNFNATEMSDTIFGNPQIVTDTADPDDVINGLGGDDTIRGEVDFSGTPPGGEDLLCGGEGNDPFIDGGDKSDKIDGGPGNDTLDGDNFPSPFVDTLVGKDGDDTFTSGQGNDKTSGGKGSDTIDVGTGTISEGADTLSGGKGDDTINGMDDGSKDTIKCGKGTDTVTAGPEDKVAKKGNQKCENITRM